MSKARSDVLVWDDYFMSIAYVTSLRSKDPNTQVGACIVNQDNRVIGLGYNGMPNNCSDEELPWGKESGDQLETKYPYVCHSEMNAILNTKNQDCKNCTIYVLLFPCNECAKIIIQAGIKKIVYLRETKNPDYKLEASRRLLNLAEIESIPYKPKKNVILINFEKY